MTTIHVAQIRSIDIRQEGNRVLVLEAGRLVLDMPYQAARTLARALLAKAAQAEEVVRAEQVIADQAILTRLGVPLGLTNSPVLQRAAANEAAWNTSLRRYIPLRRAKGVGGIRSGEIFGTPTIIVHANNKEK